MSIGSTTGKELVWVSRPSVTLRRVVCSDNRLFLSHVSLQTHIGDMRCIHSDIILALKLAMMKNVDEHEVKDWREHQEEEVEEEVTGKLSKKPKSRSRQKP